MKRLLRWLNNLLLVVETDPAMNEWYSWADVRLDELAVEVRQAKAVRSRTNEERQVPS